MKYFLSSFGFDDRTLVLGIPSEAAASLLYFSGEMKGLIEEDEGERRYSVPYFFGFAGEEIHYGIVLKEGEGEGKRRVLLLTAVEREAEIAPGGFFEPPPLLGGRNGYPFLTGLCFWTADSGEALPLLLVDPFKLADEMFDRSGGLCLRF
jgi:hypothetical protein